jgi:hypothetical protein
MDSIQHNVYTRFGTVKPPFKVSLGALGFNNKMSIFFTGRNLTPSLLFGITEIEH